ncbi:hypothetical protein MKK65_12050 [Methylobacterium sp. J-001]|uniref:hypothetical protein n=1 Tax=Methylobacterium sp. J-001 TaxID=2836609 RepID=UPI001FB9F6B5|nr:hypothetical protein [Methylobacterium sp. J-001]MCJ2117283.1 hypothetical protein [Methylobacterium sp. J-001]
MLSANNRCRLRLLKERNRFYATSSTLRSLANRGFFTSTGRLDEANSAEWRITKAGRKVLLDTEGRLTSADSEFAIWFREPKA